MLLRTANHQEYNPTGSMKSPMVGTTINILTSFSGETEPTITKVSGACHKRFKTRDQAEAFIEDWKRSFAEVYLREIKKALDDGLRPRNMKLSVGDILHKSGTKVDSEGLSDGLGNLKIDDAEAK